MSRILTIDLGTTYYKVGLFDETGRLLALKRVSPPIVSPNHGWFELDAADFRWTLTRAVQELNQQAPGGLADVAAVCFATQANSFLLLGDDDEPLTPILLRTDERACPLDPAVEELSRVPGFYRETGIPEMSGLFMPAKLHWLKLNQPEVWARARRLCLICDYLTYWITGRHITEAGTVVLRAAGSGYRSKRISRAVICRRPTVPSQRAWEPRSWRRVASSRSAWRI